MSPIPSVGEIVHSRYGRAMRVVGYSRYSYWQPTDDDISHHTELGPLCVDVAPLDSPATHFSWPPEWCVLRGQTLPLFV